MNFGATGTGLSGIGSSVQGANAGPGGPSPQSTHNFGFGSINPLLQGPTSVSNFSTNQPRP